MKVNHSCKKKIAEQNSANDDECNVSLAYILPQTRLIHLSDRQCSKKSPSTKNYQMEDPCLVI